LGQVHDVTQVEADLGTGGALASCDWLREGVTAEREALVKGLFDFGDADVEHAGDVSDAYPLLPEI
jgi:hypothetical protein